MFLLRLPLVPQDKNPATTTSAVLNTLSGWTFFQFILTEFVMEMFRPQYSCICILFMY